MHQLLVFLLIIGVTVGRPDEMEAETVAAVQPTETVTSTEENSLKSCKRVCDSNIVQQVSALDLITNCYVCFTNDCEFVRAQCQYPGRYLFANYDYYVYYYVPYPFNFLTPVPIVTEELIKM